MRIFQFPLKEILDTLVVSYRLGAQTKLVPSSPTFNELLPV